jgi:hypothetical protein
MRQQIGRGKKKRKIKHGHQQAKKRGLTVQEAGQNQLPYRL